MSKKTLTCNQLLKILSSTDNNNPIEACNLLIEECDNIHIWPGQLANLVKQNFKLTGTNLELTEKFLNKLPNNTFCFIDIAQIIDIEVPILIKYNTVDDPIESERPLDKTIKEKLVKLALDKTKKDASGHQILELAKFKLDFAKYAFNNLLKEQTVFHSDCIYDLAKLDLPLAQKALSFMESHSNNHPIFFNIWHAAGIATINLDFSLRVLKFTNKCSYSSCDYLEYITEISKENVELAKKALNKIFNDSKSKHFYPSATLDLAENTPKLAKHFFDLLIENDPKELSNISNSDIAKFISYDTELTEHIVQKIIKNNLSYLHFSNNDTMSLTNKIIGLVLCEQNNYTSQDIWIQRLQINEQNNYTSQDSWIQQCKIQEQAKIIDNAMQLLLETDLLMSGYIRQMENQHDIHIIIPLKGLIYQMLYDPAAEQTSSKDDVKLLADDTDNNDNMIDID
ncbi:MAG: hypothetical protein HRU35_06045 [Rickettsiaceae bacterium]|nr:hypothetical protein [Rickettsiaceae bacterium]